MMLPRRLPLLAGAVVLALPADGLAAARGVQSYALANGLEVILHATDAEDVTVLVSYEAGAIHDPPGRLGVAHLVQRMASRAPLPQPFATAWRGALRVAGETDGAINTERATYSTSVPSQGLKAALWVESWRMAALPGDEAILRRELSLLSAEAQKPPSLPYADLLPTALRTLYPRGPTAGVRQVADRISLAEVAGFHARRYAPENAVLVVAGRFDVAEARAAVAKYFGGLPARPPGAAPAPLVAEVEFEAVVRTRETVGRAPKVLMVWPTPPRHDKAAAAAGDVTAQILTGVAASRLQGLRDVSTHVSASQMKRTATGWFLLEAVLCPGASPEQLVARIDDILDGLRAQAPSVREVEAAARRMILETSFALGTSDGLARELALAGLALGARPPLAVARESYAAVRPLDVQGFALTHLSRSKRVVAIAIPVESATETDASAALERSDP